MAVRKASKSLPELELALRAIAMPVFANAHGDIFGGWLLSQMDLAGSAVAVRRANGRVATVAVTAMIFQRPVFVGDEVSCYAKFLKVGRTSITVKVEAFARRGRSGKQIQVTEVSSLCGGGFQNQSRGRCEVLSGSRFGSPFTSCLRWRRPAPVVW